MLHLYVLVGLCLVCIVQGEHTATEESIQFLEAEIASMHRDIYDLKNAVWGILQGFERSNELDVTMGFRERYTSPYGDALRAANLELFKRRNALREQCITDAVSMSYKYPFGSDVATFNCDFDNINKAIDIQKEEEIANASPEWEEDWGM